MSFHGPAAAPQQLARILSQNGKFILRSAARSEILSHNGNYGGVPAVALKLYSHPLASFCWKSLIALYENGAPFEAVMVDLGNPEAKARFEALWPTAKIPLLDDGGRIVPETTIMIEYLDRRHPGNVALLPRDPEDELEARLWDRVFDLYVMDPMQ